MTFSVGRVGFMAEAGWSVVQGDCLDVLRTLPDASVDAVVTDPPAGIAFMGKAWDHHKGGRKEWVAWMAEIAAECLRVLKPGGHALVWALPRTSHWTATAWEDGGFEIRDRVAHVFGSGFPKSTDVSKQIDKRGGAAVAWFGPWFRKWRTERGISSNDVAKLFPSENGGITGCVRNWELGLSLPTSEQFNLLRNTYCLPFESIEAAEREIAGFQKRGDSVNTDFMSGGNNITAPATEAAKQWQGWGTALKPAMEDWWLCRKPLIGTVAENVLKHGTGALNIDACRIPANDGVPLFGNGRREAVSSYADGLGCDGRTGEVSTAGRWPANLIHDGSDEVVSLFPVTTSGSGIKGMRSKANVYGAPTQDLTTNWNGDSGSAARFFYCAKASKADRDEGCEGMPAVACGTMEDDAYDIKTGSGNSRDTRRANFHPTVKPTALMRYLCRLITPNGGLILDPFMGSGSTGKSAIMEGFRFIGIEQDAEYCEIARRRLAHAAANVGVQGDLGL